jgi:hypothetical protein
LCLTPLYLRGIQHIEFHTATPLERPTFMKPGKRASLMLGASVSPSVSGLAYDLLSGASGVYAL